MTCVNPAVGRTNNEKPDTYRICYEAQVAQAGRHVIYNITNTLNNGTGYPIRSSYRIHECKNKSQDL